MRSEEPHVRYYNDRVVFVDEDGNTTEYREGTQSEAARQRYERLKAELDAGWFEEFLDEVTDPEAEVPVEVDDRVSELIDRIVESITSEKGRAIAGLTVNQLVIKTLEPEQSIRLHKGSRNSAHFSWEEGLSMRTIDSTYVAEALRDRDLLRVNADGVMMTRSLAENYPYSKRYKANIKGPQEEWGELMELLEGEHTEVEPFEALKYMAIALANRGERAEETYQRALELTETFLASDPSPDQVKQVIDVHLAESDCSARIYEVAIHSLAQVMEDHGLLGGNLKPLTQMRSADKKHGNIADVEVVDSHDQFHIRKAIDAKYGKPYLKGELEEVRGKLARHDETEVLSFVTTSEPVVDEEIRSRVDNLEEEYDITVRILTFDELWEEWQSMLAESGVMAGAWLRAYVETLCQRRRHRAPVNEPTRAWVEELVGIMDTRA